MAERDDLLQALQARSVAEQWEGLARLSDSVTAIPLDQVHSDIERLYSRLSSLADEDRAYVLSRLRAAIPPHPLEAQWGASAESLLVSLSHAGPLTRRMIPGVIAEHAFRRTVVPRLPTGWADHTPSDLHESPFDFLLRDSIGDVRVQVKLQRSEGGVPALIKPTNRSGYVGGMFYVETDKSRAGTDSSGQDTRGYQRGSFDILAVSMFPSARDWSKFMFTVERWLLRRRNGEWLDKYQPIPSAPNHQDWTDDFGEAVAWFRSGVQKQIGGRVSEPPAPPVGG